MKKKLKKGQGFQFPDDPTIPPPEWFVFWLLVQNKYFQFNANWRQPHWEHEFNSLPHLSPESSKAHTG